MATRLLSAVLNGHFNRLQTDFAKSTRKESPKLSNKEELRLNSSRKLMYHGFYLKKEYWYHNQKLIHRYPKGLYSGIRHINDQYFPERRQVPLHNPH